MCQRKSDFSELDFKTLFYLGLLDMGKAVWENIPDVSEHF